MNVQQTMENVQQMQNVQIQMEVLAVNVILDIQEMVSIVQVFLSYYDYFLSLLLRSII